jgi:hypothetical protein
VREDEPKKRVHDGAKDTCVEKKMRVVREGDGTVITGNFLSPVLDDDKNDAVAIGASS